MEQSDLEGTLQDNRSAGEYSGIKSNHIGVVWEGLTVSGTGGVANFVGTFPEAFFRFFNVVETAMNLFGVGKKGMEVEILKSFRRLMTPVLAIVRQLVRALTVTPFSLAIYSNQLV